MKVFSTISLIFFSGLLYSQNISIGSLFNDSLFIDLPNYMSITAENYSCKSLVVKVDNGNITGGNGEYKYEPSSIGIANISVLVKQNRGLKLLEKRQVRITYFIEPSKVVAKVGAYENEHSVSIDSLKKENHLRTTFNNSDFDVRLDIESFEVSIFSDSLRKVIFNNGNKFGEELKKEFNSMKSNCTILITKILAKRFDGSRIKLNPIILFSK